MTDHDETPLDFYNRLIADPATISLYDQTDALLGDLIRFADHQFDDMVRGDMQAGAAHAAELDDVLGAMPQERAAALLGMLLAHAALCRRLLKERGIEIPA